MTNIFALKILIMGTKRFFLKISISLIIRIVENFAAFVRNAIFSEI